MPGRLRGHLVSIDFDVLDGGYVAMQSTPRFDGLTNTELLRAMDVLRRNEDGSAGARRPDAHRHHALGGRPALRRLARDPVPGELGPGVAVSP